jgi:tau tubulin kinase
MELLGHNLLKLSGFLPQKHFTTPYLPLLFDQMLSAVEALHTVGYIHHDIKPQNFVVRHDGAAPVCLIDFGTSKLFLNPDGTHMEPREITSAIGTAYFASPNSHRRSELSRRDDLYSLFYTILALGGHQLLWLPPAPQSEVGDIKQRTPLKSLVESFCPAFVSIAEHIESLQFEDTPNYALMHQTLSAAANTELLYEWMTVPAKKKRRQNPSSFDPTMFLHQITPFLQHENDGCIIC